MIVKPVLIIGAPRSGTSLLQKILRDHPAFWSLPSESELIWDRHCHPRLRGWESEHLTAADLDPAARRDILRRMRRFSLPASVWRVVEKRNLIWSFKRSRHIRSLLREVYARSFPWLSPAAWWPGPIRLVEKTASNCFRLAYVDAVFTDARIVYPTRDGRSNVNSLIEGWLHPTRFFTYDVPVPLSIGGLEHQHWKFVLPPGWRDYVHRPLEEVCAFQWLACHEAMLAETARPRMAGRVLRLRLEDLTADPERQLRRLAEFVELPFDDYFQQLARRLPIVNSPDDDPNPAKWKRQNPEAIERITDRIRPMMQRLGYPAV